jgi:hypothetical protein
MKACIDLSLSHKDVAEEAQVRYPLTPKADAIRLLWMFYGEVQQSRKEPPGSAKAYATQLRFKLLCLFIITAERNN